MTEAGDLTIGLQALEQVRFQRVDPECADEEYDAAAAQNFAALMAFADFDRQLLTRVQALCPDHSVGAIWRRAYRASICSGRAVKSRRWKARAIGLNPEPMYNVIALSGMTPIHVDERWMLAVAIPQPTPLAQGGVAREIDDVVLIDPDTGDASVMGDAGATHIAPPPIGMVDRLPVMTDAKAWARQIALDRLEWWNLRKERHRMIQAEPTWDGWPTAALLLVDPKKMRWSALSATVLEVPAEMREIVRRAILSEARLPRVEGRA